MRKRLVLAVSPAFGALLALLHAEPASAYCRTSMCGEKLAGTRCSPASATDCGTALAWPSPCVSFDLQSNASRQVPLDVATKVFEQAFAAWTDAPCAGGGHPRIEGVDLGPVACAHPERNPKAPNANAILFRDDGWPHAGQGDALALTTVTYDLDTGAIVDADMELNAAQGHFTTTNALVEDDLLSVATHEIGHFLGISHSPHQDATMFASYTQGTISLRDLSQDDIDAICAAYPPGPPISANCDPTPQNGFSSVCAADLSTTLGGCCSVAPGAPDASRGPGPWLGALGLLLSLHRLISRRRARIAFECGGKL